MSGSKIVVAQKMLFDMRNDKIQSIDISSFPENQTLVDRYSKKLKEMRDFSEKSINIKWKN